MDKSNTSLISFLDKQQIDALSIMYTVLLSLSVTGSFSVLLVSIVRWRHLRGQVHLLVQLALADLLAAAILLHTSVVNIMKIHPDSNATDCLYRLPLSLTFYFISFLLAIIYAWKSKNAIQGWRERVADDEDEHTQCRRQITSIPMFAFVWLIPLAVYFAYVSTQYVIPAKLVPTNNISQDDCSSCILFLRVWEDPCVGPDNKHDVSIRVFLVIAVIIVMLSCAVIYFKVGKWYQRYMYDGLFPVEGDGHSRRQYKRVFSTARNIVMVIFFCWAPALILLLMSWTKVEQNSFFGLYVIQAATVSLQGFLNSMVYAWRRPNFTEAVLGENTPLLRYERKPFFEESLRR